MLYKLRDPQGIREAFREMDILTLEQIRIECRIKSISAVRQALSGGYVQPKTVIRMANKLGRRVNQIAEPVEV